VIIDCVPECDRYAYERVCECGKKQTLLTQSGPGEYDTGVYLLCTCGQYVEFILPVN
jgi:hypothetical protein